MTIDDQGYLILGPSKADDVSNLSSSSFFESCL